MCSCVHTVTIVIKLMVCKNDSATLAHDCFSIVCTQQATCIIIVGVNVLASAPQHANVLQYPAC